MKATDHHNQEILVIGAGAIGGITASYIAKAGYHIEIADHLPGLADKIETPGININYKGRGSSQKIKAWSDISDIRNKKDVILLTTKANSLESVAEMILPLLKSSSVIVSLQNGMCEEYLAKKFGNNRVIGCVVGWGATVNKPGELTKTSKGDFIIGQIGGTQANHFKFVREILSTAAPVVETDNIYGSLYSKLIISSCITTLGAISGMTLGKMLIRKKIRNIFIDVIRESVKVARINDIVIEKYAGKINFYDFADKNSPRACFKKHLIILLVGFKYRKLKSSSLQSLETGRKTEIDFLNGYIVLKAAEAQLDVPLNNNLINLVKEIESGIRKISHQNFDLPFFNEYSY